MVSHSKVSYDALRGASDIMCGCRHRVDGSDARTKSDAGADAIMDAGADAGRV